MGQWGSSAFGLVLGWAACFGMGWRPSVLMVRAIWAAILTLLVLNAEPSHRVPLIAAMLGGASSHLAFSRIIEIGILNRRAPA